MFDILVNPKTGDISYENGEITLITSYKKIVRQELEITLKTFVGEWFNNITFGGINKNYFGDPRVTKLEVDAFYRTIILSNPDVIEIIEFESSLNPFTRHYDLDFTVRTLEGPIEVTVTSADLEETYTQPDSDIYLPPTTPSIKSAAAFLTGTSSVSFIASSVPLPLVAQPMNGLSTLSGTATKILLPVTLNHVATLTATMHKAASATLDGIATLSGLLVKTGSVYLDGTASTLSGTISKTNNPVVTGIGGLTGNFVKVASATLEGTSSLSGDTGLTSDVTLQGQSGVTGTMVKVASANLSGVSTTTASLALAASSTLEGTSSLSGLFARSSTTNLTGVGSVTGTAIKIASANLVGVSNIASTMVKRGTANLSTGTNSLVASWNYGANSTVTGQSYLSATATKIKYRGATLVGTSSLSANGNKIKSRSANLTGSSSLIGTMEINSPLVLFEQSAEPPFAFGGKRVDINPSGTILFYSVDLQTGGTYTRRLSSVPLTTPFDLSTMTTATKTFTIGTGMPSEDTGNGEFTPNGLRYVLFRPAFDQGGVYDLSTAFDLNTMSYSHALGGVGFEACKSTFSESGNKFTIFYDRGLSVIGGTTTRELLGEHYSLSSPYNVEIGSWSQAGSINYYVTASTLEIQDVVILDDGRIFFLQSDGIQTFLTLMTNPNQANESQTTQELTDSFFGGFGQSMCIGGDGKMYINTSNGTIYKLGIN